LKIRPFQDTDAAFCFRVRSRAFIQKFYGQDGTPIGFFNLKQMDQSTAELPLIYLDLDHLGRGIGAACLDYIEKWLLENWSEVNTLIVDTIIPKYNCGFYLKVGFEPRESTYCEFSGQKIKALRLVKKLMKN